MEIFSGKCMKHQTSNKQPGICSTCLRDRLLQLAEAYNHNTTIHTNSLTAERCLSFSSTSTSSSPIYLSNQSLGELRVKKHVRNGSDVVRSISYVIDEGVGELKKSRSVATTMVDERSVKRGSFWKKLLRIRASSGTEGLMVAKSRTVRDRLHV